MNMQKSVDKKVKASRKFSDLSGKSTTVNGNKESSSLKHVKLRPTQEEQLLLQMEQGNFSSVLCALRVTLQAIESGVFTSYHLPPELILNSLRLVAAYTESPIGAVLATSERTEFLKAYGSLGKSLSEAQKVYRKLIDDQLANTEIKLSTTLPGGSLTKDLLENTVVSVQTLDLSVRTEAPGVQTIYNIMSNASRPGGSITPPLESQEKLPESGEIVVTPSEDVSNNDTAESSTNNSTETAESCSVKLSPSVIFESFIDKLVDEGYKLADGFKDKFMKKPDDWITVRPNLALGKTWKIVKLETINEEGETEIRDVSVLTDSELVYSDWAGPSNFNPQLMMGYDPADKRPFKIIELGKVSRVRLEYVDHELYWYLKMKMFGKTRNTDVLSFLSAEARKYFDSFRTAHLDIRLKCNVINHTCLAVVIPTREDIEAIRILGEKKHRKRMEESDNLTADGKVKNKGWFRTKEHTVFRST